MAKHLPADDAVTLSGQRFRQEFRRLNPPHQGCDDVAAAPRGLASISAASHVSGRVCIEEGLPEGLGLRNIEEYTYASQAEFEAGLAALGMRVIVSTPIWNPWIVENRFEGRFRLLDLEGNALDFPATNYVIVGQKAHPGQGVRFEQVDETMPMGYLSLSHWAHRETGEVYELVRRPE